MAAFKSNGKEIVESKHVLWMVTFTASRENVRKFITSLTSDATKATGEPCFSRSVLPTKRTGEPLGFAFVWITSRKCFDWIVGNKAHAEMILSQEEIVAAKTLLEKGYKFDENLGNFSETGVFDTMIHPSLANSFEYYDKESNDAIYCRQQLPAWCTIEMLAKEAAPYSTTGKLKVYLDKTARPVIVFSKDSDDGLFALQMMRIFRITRPHFPQIFVDLVFDHAWKSIVHY